MKDESTEDFINRMRRTRLLSEREILDLRSRLAYVAIACREHKLRREEDTVLA